MRFISFCSGSSGNCYLLQAGGETLLIDVGVSPRRLRQLFSDCGQAFSDVTAIFITHDHTDHIKGAGILAEELGVPVYATAEVHAGMDRNYCMSRKVPAELRRILTKEVAVELSGMTVTPIDVPHDSSDSVGYVVRDGDSCFALFTDVGHITERMCELLPDVDYLVLEANHDDDMLMMGPYPAHLKGRIRGERGHLSNKEGACFVKEYGSERLKHVWLCHLSEENNHPEIVRKTYEQQLMNSQHSLEITVLRRLAPSKTYDL